jgi:Mg-chelatase subunit ChlD
VVIDTEASSSSLVPLSLGFGRTIAEHAGGSYYRLSDLTAGGIGAIVRLEQGMPIGPGMGYAGDPKNPQIG